MTSIKPETGWCFKNSGRLVPLVAIPKILDEILLRAEFYGRRLRDLEMGITEENGYAYNAETVGFIGGNMFRIKEIHYDALHGLGPLGSILMREQREPNP